MGCHCLLRHFKAVVPNFFDMWDWFGGRQFSMTRGGETSLVVPTVKRLPTMQETRVQSLGGEDLLEKGIATHTSILAATLPLKKRGSKKYLGFPGGSDGKVSPYNARDLGSIPRWRRSPREENGNPLQYSCLENSMDRGSWQATVHGLAKSQT